MTRIITPAQGVVVVQLPASEFGDIIVPEKNYDSVTWGTIVVVNPIDAANPDFIVKVGDTGHWRQFKDDVRIPGEFGMYALIEVKDILGTSHEE